MIQCIRGVMVYFFKVYFHDENIELLKWKQR